jgi:hypothetical protein
VNDNFDWRTAEDGEWVGARPVRQRVAGRGRWVWPLAILVVIIAAGMVIYWQVQERLSAAEATISDDVTSSFQLIRQASADGDIELFRNLLPGSDLEWATAQQDLFEADRLFDLSPYGLAREFEPEAEVTVTLNPSLSSAEVAAIASYAQAGSAASSAVVRLQRTDVFRRGERWVWSPPRDEFWDGVATANVGFLSVSYPKRDETIALRLARDLDSRVGQICAKVERMECPEELKLDINFSHRPSAMVEMGERFASGGLFASRFSRHSEDDRRFEMTLPTPSLLGLPIDEMGYQALLRGYGSHLAIALADRFVDPDCCGTQSRFRAAAVKMLLDLDLQAWSVMDLEDLADRASELPQEQVALLCSDGFRRGQRLILLDLGQMEWREQAMQPDLLAVKGMPQGEGVLLLGQFEAEDDIHSQVWRHTNAGSELLLDLPVSQAEAERVGWELQERQGQLVLEIPDVFRGNSRHFTIDLSPCERGDCAAAPESTVSRPVWSPDGSQMMVHAYGLLWRRADDIMVPIADGSAPFWLDDQTYGYARSFGRDQALVLVTADESQSERVILTTNDLLNALDRESRPDRLLIGRVIVSPPGTGSGHDGDQWWILALQIDQESVANQAQFFAFDPESRTVNPVPHTGQLLSFNVAPSGDWMAMGGFAEDENRWQITIVDRGLEQTTTVTLEPGGSADSVPSYSWSRDESWLMILEQGLLTFYEPATGDLQKIRPPDASCVQSAWYSVATSH